MFKNTRMLIAETIKEKMQGGDLTQPQVAALKRVNQSIGESALIDCIVGYMYRLSLKKKEEVMLTTIVSSIHNKVTNEYMYHKLIEGLGSQDITVLNDVLRKNRNQLAYRVSQETSKTLMAYRNIIREIRNINFTKKESAKFFFLRRAFDKKRVEAVAKKVRSDTCKLRGFFTTLLIALCDKMDGIEVQMKSHKNNVVYVIVGIEEHMFNVEYMNKEMPSAEQMSIVPEAHKDTSMTRAISKIMHMPFTLDKDLTQIVERMIDTDVFANVIKGKSTNEQSSAAKIHNTRYSVKQGIEEWKDKGSSVVYFSYVVDFRGRISQHGGISAVGNKVGKALLRSGVKTPLGPRGYDNLLIALAGAMGHDKETFKARLKWGRDNEQMYADLGNTLLLHPEIGFQQLQKLGADDIFSAASICLELWRIKHRQCPLAEYETGILIGYDATSSAVQLVSLIMGNKQLAEASNVYVGEDTEDKIHDPYMLMAASMDKAAVKMRDEKTSDVLDMWLSFEPKVKRAVAKPLLMTRLYGSTFQNHMRSSRDIAVEKGLIDAADQKQLYHFGHVIATLFNKAFNEEEGYNALRAYEDFTKAVAKAYTSVDKHVVWHVCDNATKDQQLVTSVYDKHAGDQYYYYVGDQRRVGRSYGLDIERDCMPGLDYSEKITIDSLRARNGIAPNYIHSHDALVLHHLVNRMDCVVRLTHDCFAVTPGQLDEMHETLIDIISSLFGDNNMKRLEKLQKECYDNTGVWVELPEEYNPKGIPTEKIRRAKYMFS